MNYYLTNKKTAVITGLSILGFIMLSILSYSLLTTSSQDTKIAPISSQENNEVKKVFIKDFNELKTPLDKIVQERVENKLYSHTGNRPPDLYTGIIRQNSYSKITSNKVTTVSFIVDVRPIGATYLVLISTLGVDSTITVSCAPLEQRIDKSVECEDSEYI